MSIDIERYINYSLYKKGAISLDGIGTISLIRESSYFSSGKKEIFPPKTRYDFSENIEDSLDLANLIQSNEEITFDAAQHYVRKYCQDILNALLNYSIVKVGEIGFLEKQEENTVFIPSDKSLNKSYYGLPALELSPIEKKIKTIPVKEIATSTVINESNREKYEWLNYLGALILGGIMVLAYHYFLDPLPYMTKNQTTNVPASTSGAPSNNISKELIPIISDEEIESQKEILASDSSSNNSIEKSENLEDTSSVMLAEPKEDTECIIIVGVFNKTINALALSDRLKRDGYKPYQDDHFDTQRIGVKFKCKEKDHQAMIDKIRKQYNSKAWYLVPRISI